MMAWSAGRTRRLDGSGELQILGAGGKGMVHQAGDVHLAAIACGPGVRELYWPINRPYQPTSPVAWRRAIDSSGVVCIDADTNFKFDKQINDDAAFE